MIKRIVFCIMVSLFFLLNNSVIFALTGHLNDNVNVSVSVDKYAEVSLLSDKPDNDLWYSMTNQEFSDFLFIGDSLSGEGRENPVQAFSGIGGETRFNMKEITFAANARCIISAEVTPFSKNGIPFHNQGAYMIALYSDTINISVPLLYQNQPSGIPGAIFPNIIDPNGMHTYSLITAIQMPEEFWLVETGEYTSTITLTVVAL